MDKFGSRTDYEAVAASQTNQVLGPVGGIGDVLVSVTIIPATVAPGAVTIKDGSDTAITIYTGGTVGADLRPITVSFEEGIRSRVGAWQLSTGANVSAIAGGRFK